VAAEETEEKSEDDDPEEDNHERAEGSGDITQVAGTIETRLWDSASSVSRGGGGSGEFGSCVELELAEHVDEEAREEDAEVGDRAEEEEEDVELAIVAVGEIEADEVEEWRGGEAGCKGGGPMLRSTGRSCAKAPAKGTRGMGNRGIDGMTTERVREIKGRATREVQM